MTRANRTIVSLRQTLTVLSVVVVALLLLGGPDGPTVGNAQEVKQTANPPQKIRSTSRSPATQPLYSGIIAKADGSMDYAYAIEPDAPDADISVTTQVTPPELQARGPVVVYVEGRGGRVFGEHVNTYVSGRTGGNGSSQLGMIRDANTGNYRCYHIEPAPGDADVVGVTIVGGPSRSLPAGHYIDVVRDPAGVWWFSNHTGTDQPVPWSGVRDADVARLKDVATRAGVL